MTGRGHCPLFTMIPDRAANNPEYARTHYSIDLHHSIDIDMFSHEADSYNHDNFTLWDWGIETT